MKEHGFKFDVVFTSVLSRAIESALLICEESDNKDVPMEKAWQLNARHPGVLQGMTKSDAVSFLLRKSSQGGQGVLKLFGEE